VQQTQKERTMLDAMVPSKVQNTDITPNLIYVQPSTALMQQKGSMLGEPLNVTSLLGNALSSQLMSHSDAVFARQVLKQADAPTAFNASPFTQPMNQQDFSGSPQMASQQHNIGGNDTTMAADRIPGTEAGNTSGEPFDDVMSDADLAYAIELLKEYGVYSDVP
jgi:hypothetical protein